MTIDYEDLLKTWEPKIHKFLNTTYIVGMDREDLAQELSIAIWKAAEHYDEDKGASFHTYLHTVMVNTLRTIISKTQRQLHFHDALSLDIQLTSESSDETTPMNNYRVSKALEDSNDLHIKDEIEFEDLLDQCQLTEKEKLFVDLRIQGFTMEQISEIIEESAYKMRTKIQKKVRPHFVMLGDIDINALESEE